MRLIGILNTQQESLKFSNFLTQKNIAHSIEVESTLDWDNPDYGTQKGMVWIENEDQVEEAQKWFAFYQTSPNDPIFTSVTTSSFSKQTAFSPLIEEPKVTSQANARQLSSQSPMGWITQSILVICALLVCFNYLYEFSHPLPEGYQNWDILQSPINQHLLYDFPLHSLLLNQAIEIDLIEKNRSLPTDAVQQLVKERAQLKTLIDETYYWPGLYNLILFVGFEKTMDYFHILPMFEKISQGQLWRLITPCLLHADIFHLIFNMLWLVVIGKQIEQRLRPFNYILFISLIGIFSNTVQYIMSGPNFLGFSGVICGMIAFIWIRQKRAPWEGYVLDKTSIFAISIFIIGLTILQLSSFLSEMTLGVAIPLNIANTAHITGAFAGYLLGKTNYFSWRSAK